MTQKRTQLELCDCNLWVSGIFKLNVLRRLLIWLGLFWVILAEIPFCRRRGHIRNCNEYVTHWRYKAMPKMFGKLLLQLHAKYASWSNWSTCYWLQNYCLIIKSSLENCFFFEKRPFSGHSQPAIWVCAAKW